MVRREYVFFIPSFVLSSTPSVASAYELVATGILVPMRPINSITRMSTSYRPFCLIGVKKEGLEGRPPIRKDGRMMSGFLAALHPVIGLIDSLSSEDLLSYQTVAFFDFGHASHA